VNKARAAVTAKSNPWGLALKDIGQVSQKTCPKRPLPDVLIGFIAMNTHKTHCTTQATFHQKAEQ
jgi:hypothetical protein